jgi:intracellular multiplication protein IcmL
MIFKRIREIIMKLKAINIAIVALGLNIPFATIAATGPTTSVVSQKTDLSRTNMSDKAIMTWAKSKAVALFSYNYKNYRSKIQKSSRFFTDKGWSQFQTALKKSNNLDAVIANKLMVSAVVSGTPVILQKGDLKNVYSWRVQMPMTVTYKSPSEYSQQNIVATMLIMRTSSMNAPTGVGISQFVVTPATVKKMAH